MGALDSAFRNLASTLIGVFTDSLWTLTRQPIASYAPSEGLELAEDPTSYQVKLSPPEGYSIRDIDGTSIRRGDLRAYVAAKDITITPSHETDSLTSPSGQLFKIVSVDPIYSGDQIAAFLLQLRQ